jgi:hypothetical protein
VGNYDVNTNYQVKISRNEDHLFIQRNNQPKIEIYSYKENAFFQKDDDIRNSFKQENGRVTKVTITEGLSTKRGDRIKL